MDKLGVAIFAFDGVGVLDFAGPFEVFSRTRLTPGVESRRSEETAPIRVFMALAVVESICGRAVADETASHIEYPRVERRTLSHPHVVSAQR